MITGVSIRKYLPLALVFAVVFAFVLGSGVFADMAVEVPEAGIVIGEENTEDTPTQPSLQENGETNGREPAAATCTSQPLKTNNTADNSAKPVITQIQVDTIVTNCLEAGGKKCCNLELKVDSEKTLEVTVLPRKDNTFVDVEIWYLTKVQAEAFGTFAFVKNDNRQRQYIFGKPTGYVMNTFSDSAGTAGTAIAANLGIIKNSKSAFRSEQYKNSPYSHGWTLARYAEVMGSKFGDGSFYLVAESTTDKTTWFDSVPIPITLEWGNLEFMAAAAVKGGKQHTWDKGEETGTAFKATINKDYFSENGLLLFFRGADPKNDLWLSAKKNCADSGLDEKSLKLNDAVITDNGSSKIPLEGSFWINPNKNEKYLVPKDKISGGFGMWYITKVDGTELKDLDDKTELKFYACQDSVAEADITIVLQDGEEPDRKSDFEGETCGAGAGQKTCPEPSKEITVPSVEDSCNTVLCWMALINKTHFIGKIFK